MFNDQKGVYLKEMTSKNLIQFIIDNNQAAVANNMARYGLVQHTVLPNGLSVERVTYSLFELKLTEYFRANNMNDVSKQALFAADLLNVEPLQGEHYMELMMIRQKQSLGSYLNTLLLQEAGQNVSQTGYAFGENITGQPFTISSTQVIVFLLATTILVVGAYTVFGTVLKSIVNIFNTDKK